MSRYKIKKELKEKSIQALDSTTKNLVQNMPINELPHNVKLRLSKAYLLLKKIKKMIEESDDKL